MSDDWSTFKRIGDDISFDDLVEFSAEDEVASSVLRDASSEGTSTQAGLQTRSLQSAMDNYAAAMNQSAIAKSTGLPVRTPTQQYKGFAAEEYFKNTISVYEVLEGNANALVEELKNRKTEHSYVLEYMRHRNEVNEQINKTLHELIEDGDIELLMPFIGKITWFIQQDELMVGRQYISFDEALGSISETLEKIAKRIRYYWTKPITYLNADICYAYIELKEERLKLRNDAPDLRRERKDLIDKKRSAISDIRDKKSRRRDVGSELRSMSDSHSGDQWRWDSLWSERRSLTSDIDWLSSDIDRYSSRIDSLSSEIESLESAVKNSEATISSKKEARKKWNEKRAHIIKVLKSNDIYFRADRRIAEQDETDIIVTRLEEIQQIRETGEAEAQKIYKQEYEEIIRLHEEKAGNYEEQRRALHKKHQEVEAVCLKSEQRVSLAEKRLEFSKESDHRFVLVKLFSESSAVTTAKDEREKASAALGKAQETKNFIELQIDELEKAADAEAKSEYNSCCNCTISCSDIISAKGMY